jgi:hypothetical protein
MPPPLADAAYAHAVGVLGDGDAAAEAAILGLRKGGRSRSIVLGHVRAAAIERAAMLPAPDLEEPEPTDLVDLAKLLAFTRPADERAIVDLDTRHGLDRGALGRALGLPPALAAMRAAEVMLAWQTDLDPVVLARLGAAGCSELAELLAPSLAATAEGELADDQPKVVTIGDRLSQGAIVTTHAAGCSGCRDRLLAMVSVRTLLSQAPFGVAPPPVRAAANASRHRSSAVPPPIEPLGDAAPRARRWQWPIAIAAVVVAVIVAVTGGVIAASTDHRGAGRVDALTKIPAAGTTLDVTPSLLETSSPPAVVLRNLSDRALTWKATADAPWLSASPNAGRLNPGGFETISLSLSQSSPEGELRAAVTFTAQDGSTAITRLHTIVGRPPDVATTLNGCAITAAVVDESQIDSVVLHWREPLGGRVVDRSAVMGHSAAGYTATLPAPAAGQAWWVTATDALGNTAHTTEQTAPTCS